MILKKVIICLLILFFISCEKENINSIEEKSASVHTLLINSKASIGNEFEIKFEISVPDCWTYSRIEKKLTNNVMEIQVFIKKEETTNSNTICSAMVFNQIISENLTFNSKGEKIIKFLYSPIEATILIE